MDCCIVEIKTQTSTFRNPDFQNFHKSFMLPPPTTLVGLAGAALGLSPKASQDFFTGESIKMGVWGKTSGMTSDLWKFRNLKGKKFEPGIVQRELLFHNRFILTYLSDNKDKIKLLKQSFANPKYALTLGNSDSLAFVHNIKLIENIKPITQEDVEYCLLEGNIIKEVVDNFSNGVELSIYLSSTPICFDLPVRFEYESEYGVRKIVKRKTFSFIGKKMKLNVKKEGIIYNDNFIPAFNY
ncbi:MAG: CRISPR-associated protein Cas5 [Spirochaetes bacterium]|nr:CRISPR-associated protein Cas5 [Spirochaetota bacterium]